MEQPVKGDFYLQITCDFEDLANLSKNQLLCLSKFNFKSYLRKPIRNAAFGYLMKEKSQLSKGKDLVHLKLEMQNYLKSRNGLSSFEGQNIFMVKMRNMFLKCNFPSMFSDKTCVFHDSDDSHEGEDSIPSVPLL